MHAADEGILTLAVLPVAELGVCKMGDWFGVRCCWNGRPGITRGCM